MRFSKIYVALVCLGLAHETAALAAEKAVLRGQIASDQQVAFDVYLPLRHRAELDALLIELQNPESAHFRKFLTTGEFHERFGASAASVTTVVKELTAFGLRTQLMSPQRIHVTGDTNDVQRAFATQLREGVFKNGRKTVVAVGNMSMPPAMSSSGAVVVGIDGFIRMQPFSEDDCRPTESYQQCWTLLLR
jgi:subtilase family serine protease